MNLDKIIVIALVLLLAAGLEPAFCSYVVWRLRRNWKSVARESGDRKLAALADWAVWVSLGSWLALILSYVVPLVRAVGLAGFLVWPYLALFAERNVARRFAAGPEYWRRVLGILVALEAAATGVVGLSGLGVALISTGRAPILRVLSSALPGLVCLGAAVILAVPAVRLLRLWSAPSGLSPAGQTEAELRERL